MQITLIKQSIIQDDHISTLKQTNVSAEATEVCLWSAPELAIIIMIVYHLCWLMAYVDTLLYDHSDGSYNSSMGL